MNRLVQRRNEAGISVKSMAFLLNLTEADYRAVENNLNKSNAYVVDMACSILGVNFNELGE